jgi:rod shape-determining protein MreC
MLDLSFSRHRPLALLAAAVLAQVLLLAFQIKRDHNVRLIRYWAAAVVTPLENGATWSFSKVGDTWKGYFALRGTRAENIRLRSELDRLQIRNRELESQAAEGQRLSGLLNFRDTHPEAPMLAALVIGASADPASHTIFVNRGERDHVHRDMAVVTPDGIVGKIVDVFPSTAQVILLDDKESGVGALLADTRTHGVVKGTGDPDPGMDYVVNDEKVHAGEMILTSGEDRIFPKGLLVGFVASAAPGNPFQMIRVHAAARLDRLEDVLILLSQQDLTPKNTSESADGTATQSNPSGVVQTDSASPPVPAPSAGNAPAPAQTQPSAKAGKPPAAAPKAQPPAASPRP